MRSHARYYAAIRANTLKTRQMEPTVRAAMRRFKALYPDAEFPDIYFLIGRLTSGGTASPDGLLMGTELFSRSPEVPVDELDPRLQLVTKSIDLLPSIVVHELMHFQQHIDSRSLLGHALSEGGADFVASLVVEGNFNESIHAYGYQHEAELKQAFRSDLAQDDHSPWFGAQSMKHGRPPDLGYFIGFRIAQAYYQRAGDKAQAVRELLNISDPARILAQSAYLAP
ncbi:hypothetical protein [Massilia sp. NR 4-1]|uniref:hypothetical protein n=1 Tax=Massilia sp. NR 4-1 TaxID=1678028 RepID=UPI00067D88F1|nr:hypothetical protein [Massilia sp. NR 4-1]